MECAVCKRDNDETHLFDGIYDGKISKICPKCAKIENIPIIKKPTPEQLVEAERRYSVKERMEKLSGLYDDKQTLSRDQTIANKNLAKLRFPIKKQQHPELVDNYYWLIQQIRRRKKFTIAHVSKETGIPENIIEIIERGILPKEFKNSISKLENFFNIQLFKKHQIQAFLKKPSYNRQDEEKVFEEVKQKIHLKEEKLEKINKISEGKMDFSKPENIKNITLSDLIELKKKKETAEKRQSEEKLTRDMFGDDLELEDES